MYKPIAFVKPQEKHAELSDVKSESPPPTVSRLSGEEAQSFYEDLLGLPSTSYPAPVISTSQIDKCEQPISDPSNEQDPVNQPIVAKNHKVSPKDLFLAAQNGQYKELRRILFARTLDLDVQDAFGWSALSCAAYEGHVSCVKLLLKFGATRDLRDNKGQTALDLARKRNKIRVYQAIKEFGSESQDNNDRYAEESVIAEPENTRCTLCGVEFDVEQQKTHESSIVHRAAVQVAVDPSYGIPEASIGFRMLKQMGWKREQGLGINSQGRKFPVTTQLKRDREGLGLTTKRFRITHFNHKDPRAVSNEKTPGTKIRRMSSKKTSDKNLERDFRRAFY
ncbi:G patch domain and ankyrin repeat-containing protein 1 homolog [Varroa destructor]|uniref:G-patch domain-containing protein n=1 Tax=Varroa destructor TaxID=109461 RepID=A0A7M7KQ26_VARDE|nr:G patch domain and ankyrin repeat-containing protein 1 homolog [Varroa destructor]